jgi:hypothetical protein
MTGELFWESPVACLRRTMNTHNTKAGKITTVHLGTLAVNGSFTLARGMEF